MRRTIAVLFFLLVASSFWAHQNGIIQWEDKNGSAVHTKKTTPVSGEPAPKQEKTSIYKWVDKNGVSHFSDRKPTDKEKKTERIAAEYYKVTTIKLNKDTSSGSSKKTKKNVKKRKKIRKKSAKRKTKNNVVIYTASWCGYCRQAVAFLRSHNIPFKEYDIDRDKAICFPQDAI